MKKTDNDESKHTQLQLLTGKIESQDKLHAKFQEVFQRASNVNNIQSLFPMLLVCAITIEPVITMLLQNTAQEGVISLIQLALTSKVFGASVLYLLIRQKKRRIERLLQRMLLKPDSENEVEVKARERLAELNYHVWMLVMAVVLFLMGSIVVVVQYQLIDSPDNDKLYTGWVQSRIQTDMILTAAIITTLQIRFKYKKQLLRVVYASFVLSHNVIALCVGNQLITFYCTIAVAVISECTIWRMDFLKQEQRSMLKEFDQEALSLRREAEIKFRAISEEFEKNANNFGSTRAEELLTKLRLLKYRAMIKKNDAMRNKFITKQKYPPLNLKVQASHQQPNVSRFQEEDRNTDPMRHSVKEFKSVRTEEPKEQEYFFRKGTRQLTALCEVPTKISHDSPPNTHTMYSSMDMDDQMYLIDSVEEDVDLTLQIDEINDLIKLITGRKEQIWLPQFLRSAKTISSRQDIFRTDRNECSPEARNFILDHFTEKEFNFSLQKSDKQSSSPEWNIGEGKNLMSMAASENNFNFDLFELCENNQPTHSVFVNFATFLFIKFSVHKTLQIHSNSIMMEFFHRLEQMYLNNPYHNSVHAADVANAASFFLVNGLGNLVTEFEAACLLVSCLAHDLGHPGLNNGYMVATKSKQALIYNDQSVLENYHASLLFHTLQDDKMNIIQHLTEVDRKGFRKYCLTLILDTDLQKHFQLLSKFKNYIALGEKNLQDEQNKLLLLSITIKCADVSHGAKSLKLHKIWSRRIVEEFFQQGDLELKEGIPVTPMCDRNLSVTKSQEGFLKVIVKPLFEAFQEFIPEIVSVCLDSIDENVKYWVQQQQMEKQDEEEKEQRRPTFYRDTDYIVNIINRSVKKELLNGFI